MGISGFFSYLAREGSYEIIDIVDIAYDAGGLEILIDFNAYMRHILELITRKMVSDFSNNNLLFPGGEFDFIYKGICEFHKAFTDANIKLVWIVDGPKDVDKISSNQKQETWNASFTKALNRSVEVLKCCRSKKYPKQIDNLLAMGTFDVVKEALKNIGADVLQLLQGESDDFVAFEFHRRKSFAIITNDADFLLFPNCNIIFYQLMNISYGKNDLNLPFVDENPGRFFKKPVSFKCPLITQDKILQLFEFTSVSQLILLGVLKGNDNTRGFATELQQHLQVSGRKTTHICDVSRYIKKHKLTIDNFLEFPKVMEFSDKKGKVFMEAVEYCRERYSLIRVEANIEKSALFYRENIFSDPLTEFLANKLSDLEIWNGVYSLHFGTNRDIVHIESPDSSCESITTVMSEIRLRIYPYVLNKNLHEVVECHPRREEKFITIPVEHRTPKTHQIQNQSKDLSDLSRYGLTIFDLNWSHLETGPLNYFERFGLINGFKCYVLRYFYKITRNKNLNVTTPEFQALFVTVFYHSWNILQDRPDDILNREAFLSMNICPSEKCLIIISWFLRIYCYAKYLYGGALNLTIELPSPQNVFTGSVFFAFYENAMNNENERAEHLDTLTKNGLITLEKYIFEEYHMLYRAVKE